jgi:hypothetical protein
MLDMKVDVEEVLGVSMIYAMTVGKEEANDSKRMLPEADHTKTSICPGVSIRKCFGGMMVLSGGGLARFSSKAMIWSILVAKRFSDVKMPPFGPRLYCFMTSL